MAIVGFNFTRVSAERGTPARGRIEVKNNVQIKEVEKTDFSFGAAKQAGLKIIFEFKSVYNPKIGEIALEGELLDIEDEKSVQEVLGEWKKKKKLPDNIMSMVINSILTKCNIEALIMSKELNLPPPIPMPKVVAKPKQ